MIKQVIPILSKFLGFVVSVAVVVGLLYVYQLRTEVGNLTYKLEVSKNEVLVCYKDLTIEKSATTELISSIEVQNTRVREIQALLSAANKEADRKVREILSTSERDLSPANNTEELNEWLLDILQ